MHSKLKGNVGQFETASFLAKHGYSIFTEEGDLSRIDVIAEKDGNLIRFQCKCVVPVKNTITLSMRKCGPKGYSFSYKEGMFDWFSVYDLVNDNLYWIPANVLQSNINKLVLRLNKCRQSNSHMAEEYLASKQILSLS